ncbi:hypothetical protein SAMN05444340_11661 [Citreimonas salinaria]|uniref:Uncharacterized protein n=1 Tax=Citreimonas salinaria TaxID=321339 RepID=A0A1H3MBY4_9RHOB|nr:hypothetical protein SAMN05444340_11661 [Citreimonas salinaria]
MTDDPQPVGGRGGLASAFRRAGPALPPSAQADGFMQVGGFFLARILPPEAAAGCTRTAHAARAHATQTTADARVPGTTARTTGPCP